jgi:hypothetical protein
MNRFAVRQRDDALDYAVNDGLLYVGIFDAMGHGLAAAGVAAFALRRAPPEPARPLLAAGVPTERGASVKPVTHATASRVGRSAGQS